MKIIMISALMSAALLLAPAAHGETYQSNAASVGGGDYVGGMMPLEGWANFPATFTANDNG